MTKFKRVKADAQPEADLVTGLIVSSKFCKAIIPILDLSLFRWSYYKTISSWVKTYYENHGRAPFKTIGHLFDEKEEGLDEAQAAMISKFLANLSQDYENGAVHYDSSYQAEKAAQYLKGRRASILIDKIKNTGSDDLTSVLSEGKDDIEKLSLGAGEEFKPDTLEDLEEDRDVTSVNWIVRKLIPYGLTLLWGRPKAGKSLLSYNISVAIASETKAFGINTRGGRVLHISLEDGKKRTIERLKKIRGKRDTKQNLEIIASADGFKPLLSGGLQDIRSWLERTKDPRLVVIDTLERVRPRDDEPTYKKDYHSLKDLQALAMEYMVAIVVIHHTKKTLSEHHTSDGYGTHGLAGVADTVISVSRHFSNKKDETQEISVKITGRDIEDKELSFESTDGEGHIWNYVGDTKKYRKDTQKQAIIDLLEDVGEPMAPQEIKVEIPGIKINTLWQTLSRMSRHCEIDRVGPKGQSGKYAYPGYFEDLQNQQRKSLGESEGGD